MKLISYLLSFTYIHEIVYIFWTVYMYGIDYCFTFMFKEMEMQRKRRQLLDDCSETLGSENLVANIATRNSKVDM